MPGLNFSDPRRRRRRRPGGNGRRRRRRSVGDRTAQDSAESSDSDLGSPKAKRNRRTASEERLPKDTAQPQPQQNSPQDSPEDYDIRKNYTLHKTKTKQWKKGPVTESIFEIDVHSEGLSEDPMTHQIQLYLLLESAFRSMLDQAPPGATAQVVVAHPAFHKQVVATCLVGADRLRFSHLADRLEAVLQSDESIELEHCSWYLTTWERPGQLPVGGRTRTTQRRFSLDPAEDAKDRRCAYDPVPKQMLRRHPESKSMCWPLLLAKELKVHELSTGPNAVTTKQARIQLRNYSRSEDCWSRALELVWQAGFGASLGPFTLTQMADFKVCLPSSVCVNVFAESAPPVLRFGDIPTATQPKAKSINVWLVYTDLEDPSKGWHCWGLGDGLRAFMGAGSRGHVCHLCFKKHYSERSQGHLCDFACRMCQTIGCPNETNDTTLPLRFKCPRGNCPMQFRTQTCQSAHECGHVERCQDCHQLMLKRLLDKHKASGDCGKNDCSDCGTKHSPMAYCFVSKPELKTAATEDSDDEGSDSEDDDYGEQAEEHGRQKRRPVWFADSETMIDEETGEHEANLFVLVNASGSEQHVFTGSRATHKFTDFVIAKASPLVGATLIFHNASGFDNHVWWKVLSMNKIQPQLVRKGQRVISMTLPNDVQVRDSLQFVTATPLRDFPAMFNLPTGPKGDFCHGLNTKALIRFDGIKRYYEETMEDGRVLRFPALKYFWPHLRRGKARQELIDWHAEQTAKFDADPTLRYCPEAQLVQYCKLDTEILRAGFGVALKAWRKQCKGGKDVLSFMTFSSFNNYLFRSKYMTKDHLAIISPEGFWTDKSSKIAEAWLSWQERALGLTDFRTARKGSERSFGSHKVDGSGYDANGVLHLLDFHGSWYHGCDCSDCPVDNSEQAKERRARTAEVDHRMREMSRRGVPYGHYVYTTVTECQLKRLCKDPSNEKMAKYLINFQKELQPPLAPRDGFRGGRVNAVAHDLSVLPPGYRLSFLDFVSLYPSIQAGVHGERWPIGHATVYLTETDIRERAPPEHARFGLAKVRVLAPKDLLLPVLGLPVTRKVASPDRSGTGQAKKESEKTRTEQKILFFLCRTCAENSQEGLCNHSEGERAFESVFCTPELQLAVEQGYRVLRWYEYWGWDRPDQSSTEVFKKMILSQFRHKLLASEAPKSETDFARLQSELNDLGISVERKDFNPNAARKALKKRSLNSIWGFLGMRGNPVETSVITELADFYKLQNDETKTITQVEMSPDANTLFVMHKDKRERAGRNQSIILAIFTTAFARMALYSVMRQYPLATIYFDTDSVVLLLKDGEAGPPTSSALGQLQDEITSAHGPDARMVSFAACGAKCYSFRVEDKQGRVLKQSMKVKGVAQTAEALQTLNSAALYDLTRAERTWTTATPASAYGHPSTAPSPAPQPSRFINVKQSTIFRDFFKHSLRSADINKKIKFTSNKRWFPHPELSNRLFPDDPPDNLIMRSLPYGYGLPDSAQ